MIQRQGGEAASRRGWPSTGRGGAGSGRQQAGAGLMEPLEDSAWDRPGVCSLSLSKAISSSS